MASVLSKEGCFERGEKERGREERERKKEKRPGVVRGMAEEGKF